MHKLAYSVHACACAMHHGLQCSKGWKVLECRHGGEIESGDI